MDDTTRDRPPAEVHHDHTHHHQLHLDRAERKAQSLFVGTALVAAITVAGMQVSGWGGGVLRNDIEVLFWAGAILGGVGIGLLGLATLPNERVSLITGLTRAGTLLFLVAPVMCVSAVFIDYWI
jgi:hypothetical protein